MVIVILTGWLQSLAVDTDFVVGLVTAIGLVAMVLQRSAAKNAPVAVDNHRIEAPFVRKLTPWDEDDSLAAA